MNKSRKIISIVAAATLAFSTVALAGCGSKVSYEGEKLNGKDPIENVYSNGGFAVETDGYVYFINGVESSDSDNTYGDVKKGSLMRISKEALAGKNYDEAQIVVPSLFVSGDKTAGIFIYDGYVYYATPTTDRNKSGEVEKSYLDFKCSKLDGSEAPSNYFLRLSSNTTKYRFVKEKGAVYCLYEEGGALKSYNVTTGDNTVLVSGAKSSFYYDLKDPTNPNVYYTMAVTYDLDETNHTSITTYDQVYCVNAATKAIMFTGEDTVGYAATLGGEGVARYEFKKDYVEENGEVGDYTTYPYVNLGSLVLDGVGSASVDVDENDPMFNPDRFGTDGSGKLDYTKPLATEPSGYLYTIQNYQNGGLYFTRKPYNAIEGELSKLYYLADTNWSKNDGWNTVTGNGKVYTVATDKDYANSSALYEIVGGTHVYFYLDGSILKMDTVVNSNVVTTKNLAYEVSSATLWKTEGNYLYYYASGTNGNNLTRINYTGKADDYKQAFFPNEEYKPQTLPLVDWKSDWYQPEFVTVNGKTAVLYCNAQSYGAGSTAYNYVYATELGTTEEIVETKEKLANVNEFIDSYTEDSQLQAVMDYYLKTGKTEAFDAVREAKKNNGEELYTTYQRDEFDAFVGYFDIEDDATTDEIEGYKGEWILETEIIGLVGRMTDVDEDAIEEDWANSLLSVKDDETKGSSGASTLAIVFIVIGSVLVVGGAAVAAVLYFKNKAEEEKRAQEIVNAYQRKEIDTTDDKSIDVYADEEATEETVEEEAEEIVEEVEEAVEEPVEEAAEAPSEE